MDLGSPDKRPERNIEENGASFAENVIELHGDTSVQEEESLGNENEAADAVLQFETNEAANAVLQFETNLEHIGSSILPTMCDEGVPPSIATSDLPGSSPRSKRFGEAGLSIMSDLERESIGITTDYTTEGQRSVLEDYQTENKEERCDIGLSDDPLDGSTNKIINTEAETESSNLQILHSHNHLITFDSQNSGVVDNEVFSCQSGKSPTFSEETNGDFRNIVENTQSENTEIVMEEVDSGNYDNSTAKEYYDLSGMVTSGNEGIGSQNVQNASSPERQMSIPPPMSPQTQPSTVQEKMVSPANGDRKAAPSPSPPKCKRSPSPEKIRVKRKRTSTSNHLSPSIRQKSSSERTPPRDSPHKDSPPRKRSASPRRRQSPRRRDRSASRSPTRRRDSSGYRRDHRGRSRSRSPYGRDRSRRSPRRRPSPRRRSPPNYHSHRRSPRRPWSPPANRNPGIGKPGNNLFVAGFSYVTTERDLERKFSRYGRVTDGRIVRDKRTGDSRGFGFLSLERDEDADAAIRALDQTEWNGRIVLVEKSKTPLR